MSATLVLWMMTSLAQLWRHDILIDALPGLGEFRESTVLVDGVTRSTMTSQLTCRWCSRRRRGRRRSWSGWELLPWCWWFAASGGGTSACPRGTASPAGSSPADGTPAPEYKMFSAYYYENIIKNLNKSINKLEIPYNRVLLTEMPNAIKKYF